MIISYLAIQARQVNIEDPSDVRLSIVLTPSKRDFEDQYNDDELGDTVLHYQGILKTMLDNIESSLDLAENMSTYV